MKNLHPNTRSIIIGALLGAIACAAFALASCATTQRVTTPILSVVKDCADTVTHQATLSILDDVSAVLVCDGGNAEALPACVITQLGALAVKWGWSAIDCALDEIRQKASANVTASEDTVENLRARRAQAAQDWRALQSNADGGAP